MNLQICLALIYFNVNIGIYAWRPFYRNLKQNKYSKEAEIEHGYQFEAENIKNKTDNVRNRTNHTFLDDEEFMKILRFYRPI